MINEALIQVQSTVVWCALAAVPRLTRDRVLPRRLRHFRGHLPPIHLTITSDLYTSLTTATMTTTTMTMSTVRIRTDIV